MLPFQCLSRTVLSIRKAKLEKAHPPDLLSPYHCANAKEVRPGIWPPWVEPSAKDRPLI